MNRFSASAFVRRELTGPAAARDGRDEPVPAAHTLRLVAPALASWATALILLGCPAPAGAVVSVASAACALLIALPVRLAGLRSRSPEPCPSHVPASVRPQPAPPSRRRHTTARQRRDPRRGVPDGPASPAPAWQNIVIAVFGCVAATAGTVAFHVHAAGTGPVAGLVERRASATVEAVLTDDPREIGRRGGTFHRESFVVSARVEAVETPVGRVRVRAPVVLLASGSAWRPLLPSQRIELRGRFGRADPGELLAAVILARGSPRVLDGPSWAHRVAGTLRAGLREAADVLPPAQRGLLPGLVVGDVSRMDEQVTYDFREAGLSHLLAVSGANLAIVAGATVALARTAGLPLAARGVLAVLAMLAFAVVARPSPSVLRALVMGTVAAAALGTGRSRDGVTALSVTVLGLILFDPALARSYGFALSVCATGGILTLAPRWRDRMAARMPRRVPRWVAEAVAVPTAAQAAVTPILVLMSGQLTPVAVPANLLAGPAVAPATLLGFAAALAAPVLMPVAQVLVRPAGLATGWIIEVARHAAGLPLAVLPWPGGVVGLVLLAGSAPVAALVLRHRRSRRIAAAALAGVLTAAVLTSTVAAGWPPRDWLLVACDVGQGDALLVAAGPGRAVVVDTGPDPVPMDRCLRSMEIEQVPLVILTHPHADHTGGLDGVFRGRPVGAVLVSPGTAAERGQAALSGDLARRRVARWTARPGARWRLGPSELTVVGPPEGPPEAGGGGAGAEVNNASVVVHVRWAAGTALLSGDIETEAQTELLRQGFPPADVLKVPHHGSSRYDPDFFAAVGARAALISAGAGNDYGHPAQPTLALLNRLGVRTHRTDLSGDLAVVARGGGLAVVTRGRSSARERPPS
ncbi:ComEC/Rec2 family competence protein [Planomonospora sp. ID67723]|uniref:ComEC/Rec2 family competence protein n=1 Tax=Planomonospora sp. ID67723 TaxID=2738134 RepID=UPI0018C39A13|nr:ComEC/Rec2 family competence protein [Planomonospora sp. ID67723]MBG0828917.1 ComEC/Rec2 family competence protein [Planomonospora sp. ID67723]